MCCFACGTEQYDTSHFGKRLLVSEIKSLLFLLLLYHLQTTGTEMQIM